jgi:hypothetical protein
MRLSAVPRWNHGISNAARLNTDDAEFVVGRYRSPQARNAARTAAMPGEIFAEFLGAHSQLNELEVRRVGE